MTPIRVTAVLTHPVQYYSPWFQHIAAHAPDLELSVIYATVPTPEQQGTGFGRPFNWDVALLDGYRSTVLRAARPGDRVDSHSFFGVDASGLARTLRATGPDVVLVPGWHSIVLVKAILASRRMRVPVLFRGDTNLAAAPEGWKRSIWHGKTRRLLALFDGYLSPGIRTREYLQAMDVDPWQIVNVPHAVDNDRFAAAVRPFESPEGRTDARAMWGLPAEGPVALFVGKLEEKKRPLDLIRAAASLHPRPSVLVVGSGELEAACRAEAVRLGVRAAFTGFLNQSELGAAYAAADMLVLPSDGRETWGLVANEALASGLPVVISHKVGCAPDLVTEQTGAVFTCGDVEGLSAAIERVRTRARVRPFVDDCRARARFRIRRCHSRAGPSVPPGRAACNGPQNRCLLRQHGDGHRPRADGVHGTRRCDESRRPGALCRQQLGKPSHRRAGRRHWRHLVGRRS